MTVPVEKSEGWTVGTLHRLVLHLLEERDKQHDQQYKSMYELVAAMDKRYEQVRAAQDLATQLALTAQKDSVAAALVSADRAVTKAEGAAKERLDSMNEFRGTLSDQATTFITRNEAEQRLTSTAEKMETMMVSISERVSKLENFQSESLGISHQNSSYKAQNMWMIGIVVAILLAVGSLITSVITKK